MHAPALQICAPTQKVVQPPQCAGSPVGSTQRPSQDSSGAVQVTGPELPPVPEPPPVAALPPVPEPPPVPAPPPCPSWVQAPWAQALGGRQVVQARPPAPQARLSCPA